MSIPTSNPTKTLQLDNSSFEVNEAIAFIPALSAKYKIASANPEHQTYTLSDDELSGNGVYIDISYSSNKQKKTIVTLVGKRKRGSLKKSSELSMVNQHFNTVFNLLSDSLALDLNEKARLLSTKTNKRTAGEYRLSQEIENDFKKGSEPKQARAFTKQGLVYFVSIVLLAAILYGLYRYF